ncbi:doublecortin domain-containing protein 2-like [Scomber scombrus]|uniref:Doublecortin domain-containing protein 2 n=1 Tax=Scomber scombrus TaxID=13677 RepID=A0AAV1N5X6_SCOSC|nr:doublecortin domain-containing protein 2-like [Scomber scombrus]
MSSEKPNFRSQPVVKSVFMFRNGDPYYNARRIVINQKRVCNFETLLREVTGGIQAPFGAVRNIYTPRGGHKVDCLESLQSGEQYVAAGKERFKKLDYLQIGSRRKRMLQTLPMQAKPLPQHRIVVSARFLKPIKEPCPIFMVANGDVLNPAMRLLIHQRMLSQFDKILEMITEKMGLRVLGGVRSLYTYEGHQVTDGNQLESGQLYVAVGREKFKKLPYSDLLFTKPRGTQRVNGMKAYSLPPIYRFSKQNGNSKSMVRCSDSGDGDSKSSPPGHSGNNKEHLSSIIREISQTRLISLRKKRSGQSMTLGISDNDDQESKADDKNTEGKSPQMEQPKEKPAVVDTKASEENGEKAEDKEETSAENTTGNDTSASKEEMKENEETHSQVEGEKKKENEETSSQMEGEKKNENVDTSSQIEGEEKKENEETSSQIEGEEKKEDEETSSQIEGEEKKENEETSSQIKGEEKKENEETNNEKEGQATVEPEEKEKEQSSSSNNNDKTQDRKETEDSSSGGENNEQDKTIEETQDTVSGNKQESSKDPVNDEDTGKQHKEKENSNDPGKTQSDNETKENNNSRSSSRNSNQEESVSKTKEDATKEAVQEERQVNGDVSGEDDEVESEGEQEVEEKNSASHKDATANGKKGENDDSENQDKSRKAED